MKTRFDISIEIETDDNTGWTMGTVTSEGLLLASAQSSFVTLGALLTDLLGSAASEHIDGKVDAHCKNGFGPVEF